jgi:hypothetical protein
MKSKDGFVQAYNTQAAVDAEAQIIVAHDVTQSASDCGQLIPMTDAIEINLGRKPEQLSADAGYCSEANLEALENRNIDAYVATGRARDAVAGTVTGETTAAQLSPDEPRPVRGCPAKSLQCRHTTANSAAIGPRRSTPLATLRVIRAARLRFFFSTHATW